MFGSILLGVGIGVVVFVLVLPFAEGCGTSFLGTKKRRDIDNEIDQRIENKRANGDFKHSKTELQDHWDQHH